jgi:RNA polymerase sigma-70 factor (ECF subfamily)
VDSANATPPSQPGELALEAEGPPAVALSAEDGPLAFRPLFDQHFSYVWHALRRLGVAQRDLEDLAHDVFIEVYRTRHRYDPTHPIRAWLFGFAFRLASNYRRRARQRYEVFVDPADCADAAPSPLESAVTSEALSLAHRALEALEMDRRAVFLMHEVDGFSIPEVAHALAIPLNTAYSRLRLARRDFLEQVGQVRAKDEDP